MHWLNDYPVFILIDGFTVAAETKQIFVLVPMQKPILSFKPCFRSKLEMSSFNYDCQTKQLVN